MVALSAAAFWSSQNCTAFSSSMRFSRSSTFNVGATQLPRLGSCGMLWLALPAACLARFCRKSKPGTSLPKPANEELSASLMGVSWRGPCMFVCSLCSDSQARQPLFFGGAATGVVLPHPVDTRNTADAPDKLNTCLNQTPPSRHDLHLRFSDHFAAADHRPVWQ